MTEIVLSQYAPGGVMKQLGDAAGGIAYNQYAPGGCYRQLYDASGLTDPPSQYAPGGPIGQIEQELEGGGGEAAPEWVPDNAVIHIDLVGGSPQGRAWVEGAGAVAVDTLLGNDPNTSNGWGTTGYDPADLTADGYVAVPATPFAFIGSAKTKALAGSTTTVRTKHIIADPINATVGLISTEANSGLDIVVSFTTHRVEATSYNGDLDIDLIDVLNHVLGAANVVAYTLTPTRLEIAVNGSDVAEAVLTEDDFPTSGDDPITAVLIKPSNDSGVAIQSITLYDALPSTAGLSDLSEVT